LNFWIQPGVRRPQFLIALPWLDNRNEHRIIGGTYARTKRSSLMRLYVTAVTLLVFASIGTAQDIPYAAAASRAFAERKPLVVFIGMNSRPIEGAVTTQVQSLEGYDKSIVVVSKPGATWLEWVATLKAGTTDAEIMRTSGLHRGGAVEALDEVNAVRRNRGLPPYAKDDSLTKAAMSAAQFRAERRMVGHTPNDFSHVPQGSSASAAGCAAWTPDWGWGSCCTYENWSYAGAAYVVGEDGRRYMHLFVR
jgi:hypothetical protein